MKMAGHCPAIFYLYASPPSLPGLTRQSMMSGGEANLT
jgi:hypothetical protein